MSSVIQVYGVPQIDLSDDNEASVDLQAELSLSSDQHAIERFTALSNG